MRKLVLWLLGKEAAARNLANPGDGMLGAFFAKKMSQGNRRQSEDAAERLEIGPDHCVLELGPGSGWGFRALAAGRPKRLIGVEVSARLRQELAGLGLSVDHEIRSDDAIDMSGFLADGSVDRLLAVNVVYFLDPLADYAAELFRVMAPGSRGLLACKFDAIKAGNDNVFLNKDQQTVSGIFENAGFGVSSEKIDSGDPLASYTAMHLTK